MHVADDAFVSLADLLRPQAVADAGGALAIPVAVAPVAGESAAADIPRAGVRECARDVRLFRARLGDAFDAARDALLRELAYAVLGRELLLGAAEVATIAARILAEHPLAQPLRIRVAPGDVFALDAHADALPVIVCDASLAPGDAILELTSGTIDAQLGVRLAVLLETGT